MDTSTGLPFAVLLVVYDRHKRSKLNPMDLAKIVKKYGRSPETGAQLLRDLDRKRPGDEPVPRSVSVCQLVRLLGAYGDRIPLDVRRLLPAAVTSVGLSPAPAPGAGTETTPEADAGQGLRYDPRADILSQHFDAAASLNASSSSSTSSSCSSSSLPLHTSLSFAVQASGCPPCDNLSKVQHLLPGFQRGTGASTEKGEKAAEAVVTSERLTSPPVHPFERIARATLLCAGNKTTPSSSSSSSSSDAVETGGSAASALAVAPPAPPGAACSTFSLLYAAVHERCRVHVAVRGRNSVRGYVEGVLLAFDRHFNLLLGSSGGGGGSRSRSQSQASGVVEEYYIKPTGFADATDRDGFPVNFYRSSTVTALGACGEKLQQSKKRLAEGAGGDINQMEEEVLKQQTESPRVVRRQLHQLLVRGDSVVLVRRCLGHS